MPLCRLCINELNWLWSDRFANYQVQMRLDWFCWRLAWAKYVGKKMTMMMMGVFRMQLLACHNGHGWWWCFCHCLEWVAECGRCEPQLEWVCLHEYRWPPTRTHRPPQGNDGVRRQPISCGGGQTCFVCSCKSASPRIVHYSYPQNRAPSSPMLVILILPQMHAAAPARFNK